MKSMDMMNYPLVVRVGHFKGFCINSLKFDLWKKSFVNIHESFYQAK